MIEVAHQETRIVAREGDVVLSVSTPSRRLYSVNAKYIILQIAGDLVTLVRRWSYPRGAVRVVTWAQFVSDFRILATPAREPRNG